MRRGEEKAGTGIIARKYANDIFKEAVRKSIHLCAVIVPLSVPYARTAVLSALTAVSVLYCIAEFARIRGCSVFFISKITEIAARRRDGRGFVLGPVTLALGILCTELFFRPVPAAIGIFALAVGDGLASLFGKLFGGLIIPYSSGKTVVGSLTCFTAVFISTWLITKNSFASLIIAIAGMIIELIPLKDFDNLFIPIILALIAQYYFHI